MKIKLPARKLKTEQDVLKALGIPDFRHVTKDSIMSFCGMLDRVDPEVAKAVIAQFPDFARNAREALLDYREMLKAIVESDTESESRYYDVCDEIIKSLAGMLEDEELSFEQKQDVIEQMRDIEAHMCKKDSEHKRHSERLALIAAGAVMAFCCSLVAVLGGKVDIDPGKLDGAGAA